MITRWFQTAWLRRPALRRVMAGLCVLVYLVAGALHGACDLDVTTPAAGGMLVMSMAPDASADLADKATVGDHHCHGCFSVSVPAPSQAGLAQRDDARPVRFAPEPMRLGAVPLLDTPPPKHLT
ncbi:MAG: hypothetical protein AB1586_27315 [Pseudomonadota bacterium]|jgi:hypothetical protein